MLNVILFIMRYTNFSQNNILRVLLKYKLTWPGQILRLNKEINIHEIPQGLQIDIVLSMVLSTL